MKISVLVKAYNFWGSCRPLSDAGDLLLGSAAPRFGVAIDELFLTAHLESRGPPVATLESLAQDARELQAKLPKVVFRRKERRLEISYLSRVTDAETVRATLGKPRDAARVREAYREVVATTVALIGKRLKRSDDFDVGALVTFLERRVAELDATPDVELLAELERVKRARELEPPPPDEPPAKGKGAPKRLAIDPDEGTAQHVGRTSDGRQFFLTTPFVPKLGREEGAEFVALYVFDPEGVLLEAKIDAFGPRAALDGAARRQIYEQRLRELGDVTLTRIQVAPFAVQRFGRQFGLITRAPDGEAPWRVEAMPGNYMAFYSPWDSGDYDT